MKKQHKRRGYLIDCYERLVTKHTNGLPTLKQQVRELIVTKWNNLLDQKNWAVFTNLQDVEEQHQPNQEIGRFYTTCNNDNLGGFPDLCIVVKPTNFQGIEKQVEQLQKVVVAGGGGAKIAKCGHCRKELNEPIHKGMQGGVFCNERCENMKKRRNDKSNPRNGFKKKYHRSISGVFLFDQRDFVRLSDNQKKWLLG